MQVQVLQRPIRDPGRAQDRSGQGSRRLCDAGQGLRHAAWEIIELVKASGLRARWCWLPHRSEVGLPAKRIGQARLSGR